MYNDAVGVAPKCNLHGTDAGVIRVDFTGVEQPGEEQDGEASEEHDLSVVQWRR